MTDTVRLNADATVVPLEESQYIVAEGRLVQHSVVTYHEQKPNRFVITNDVTGDVLVRVAPREIPDVRPASRTA